MLRAVQEFNFVWFFGWEHTQKKKLFKTVYQETTNYLAKLYFCVKLKSSKVKVSTVKRSKEKARAQKQ